MMRPFCERGLVDPFGTGEHARLRINSSELEMRLGEGTGAITGIALLRAAVATSNEMATFESAGLL